VKAIFIQLMEKYGYASAEIGRWGWGIFLWPFSKN